MRHVRGIFTSITLPFILIAIFVCRLRLLWDHSLLDPFTSMCHITRWEYCSTTAQPSELGPLNPREIVRCNQWSQLLDGARNGDEKAKKRLASHMRGACLTAQSLCRNRKFNGSTATQNNTKISIQHVSEVLAGGTCVPDTKQGRHVGFNCDPTTDK